MTLAAMVTEIKSKYDIDVGKTTIDRHLDSKMISVKKAIYETETMNSEDNKRKRKEYVEQVLNLQGSGKTILYQDETNINLYLRRTEAR